MQAWVYRARHKPQPAWPPPAKQDFWHNKYGLKARATYDRAMHVVSDDQRIYFGSSGDDQLRCLDLATGNKLWTFFAEGPIRLAPTLHLDRVYFGSDDGSVYCLNAVNGSLVWRYRVAETDRQIPGNGRIISSWPIRSGVLIDGDRARFAAGLFPLQGTYQFILDANTGKLITKGKLGFSPQGYMQQRGNSLMIPTGRSADTSLGRLENAGKTSASTLGKAPADYPFAFIGAGDLRFAGGDDKVAVVRAEDGGIVQTIEVHGKAYGLAVAGGAFLVSTDEGCVHCFRPGANGTGTVSRSGEADGRSQPPSAGQFWSKDLLARCSAIVDRALGETDASPGY
jgi:outer membrane protein assembly factor BamB